MRYICIAYFAILTACLCDAHFTSVAAEDSVKIEITQDPRGYVANLLDEVAKEGMAPLRKFLKDFGYSNLQIDQTLSMVESARRGDQKQTVQIIEEIDNAGVLRQVYAYSHLGGNAWFFWRVDFVRTAEGWALANFIFHSDYSQVLASRFKTHELIE